MGPKPTEWSTGTKWAVAVGVVTLIFVVLSLAWNVFVAVVWGVHVGRVDPRVQPPASSQVGQAPVPVRYLKSYSSWRVSLTFVIR